MDDNSILEPSEDQEPMESLGPLENQEPEESALEAQEPEKPEEEKTSFQMDLYFWTQALVMALVALILVFTLVGRVIGVVGNSMVPTLHWNDLLLLRSIGYTPEQGDVVVLRKESFMAEPIVKRVIATGGQRVGIDYATSTVTVDGVELEEPYINEWMGYPIDTDMTITDVVVPEGSIFVMGDNRNHSSDSRHQRLGTVDERYVLGKVLCVIFPFSSFGPVE